MSRFRIVYRRRVALLGAGVAAAAACVRIDTGPSGIASVRLNNPPPSIVAGDTLRDSTGAPTRLIAQAFDESGREIATAPVRFLYLPSQRDSLQRPVQDSALRVDSITGGVSARAAFVVQQALIAVRVGDRLQIVDTIDVVPRPTEAARDAAVDLELRFDCTDSTRTAQTRPLEAQEFRVDTGYFWNALGPFRVRVSADSLGTSKPARRRLVRWTVDPGRRIPPYRLPGGRERDTVSTIGVVTSTGDRLIGVDTTDANGLSSVRLRIRPQGLGQSAIATDTFSVQLRAEVQPGPTPVAGGTQQFTVRLARGTGFSAGGCPR